VQAAQAMQRVVEAADRAGDESRNMLTVAAEVGGEAGRLREGVEQFLSAVRDDAGERRRAERLAGDGILASFRRPGYAETTAAIEDLSRTGLALRHAEAVGAAAEIEIDLPAADGPVIGRVAREEGGILALEFRKDPATLDRVERALASLSTGQSAAA
jgi:methyl-accepting chemotaxis protein